MGFIVFVVGAVIIGGALHGDVRRWERHVQQQQSAEATVDARSSSAA